MQVKNKVAIVTGAGQGIGQAIAEAILQKEGKVCLSDIEESTGKKACEEFAEKYGKDRVAFFKCDVTNKTQHQELHQYAVKKFGRIDVVCNNAGVLFAETLENFDKLLNVNLHGAIIGSMIALEYFKKSGEGVIINTASGAGLEPIALINVYSASKYGVVGYTKSAAANYDLIGSKIRLNVICPMLVKTRMAAVYAGTKELDDMVEKYGVVEPSRVAEGAIRLIEDDSLNGVALKVTETYGFEFQ